MRMRSATALVIANMIGAGIFTTTGFQAGDLGHPGIILILWIVGGSLALLGALCYAELGAMMPHAGGEYVYLRETYGPAFGFMSAFVSLTAGFSAAIAAATESFTVYLGHFIPFLTEQQLLIGPIGIIDLVAVGVVWLLVIIHMGAVRSGTGFNDFMTVFKVAGIAAILLAAAAFGTGDIGNLTAVSSRFAEMSRTDTFSAFGTSLIFVMFTFSGWNAAAYVAGEMKDPQKDLPKALMLGTVTVLILYLGLNVVYFYGANVDELAGQVEVGLVASRTLFGEWGVGLVTLVLCVSILASASAMTLAGPRVYYALGKDFTPFKVLSRTRSSGAPVIALVTQGVVTSIIILSGRVDQIQQYAGFTLSLFASLAVSCVIVLRVRLPNAERPFKAWAYPLSPVLFLAVSVWMMYWALQGRPVESTLSLLTVILGGIIFAVSVSKKRK
ncbi:MAG: amino acid permease [Gemmatimonadota bacterium]|nr:amino acid permease [Gemmatimonadota bacterium]|tara:strand:+ start:76538 stop:77863 length:1326 start_codon:yes stop_codon:yes gene_type:complete